ncbi:hypothetical protein DENIS_0204 [Desulfonema ishimotonii]|uniref:Uncharacterized protein n=1 Tax=Desulfonema ishimotonii TaxID=45657 RepID=A0A401FQJ9_9BACT|nr:hypothetical protein [Desulfonema ishimotonii]GBC59268.1 hypothetical protein DENIS_0204 [Desulfonema ishimotonii]
MTSPSTEKEGFETLSEEIFNLAITRDDIKQILAKIPDTSAVNPVTLEYEIQLLKIISTGWGISFFMAQHPDKLKVAESFWNAVHQFAQGISKMSATTTGKDIDYFNILRERVDIYVNALNHFSDVEDPAIVIGPTFAKMCGSEEDAHTIATGKKMFTLSLNSVKNCIGSAQKT